MKFYINYLILVYENVINYYNYLKIVTFFYIIKIFPQFLNLKLNFKSTMSNFIILN